MALARATGRYLGLMVKMEAPRATLPLAASTEAIGGYRGASGAPARSPPRRSFKVHERERRADL
jgi:hypothetical protein